MHMDAWTETKINIQTVVNPLNSPPPPPSPQISDEERKN